MSRVLMRVEIYPDGACDRIVLKTEPYPMA